MSEREKERYPSDIAISSESYQPKEPPLYVKIRETSYKSAPTQGFMTYVNDIKHAPVPAGVPSLPKPGQVYVSAAIKQLMGNTRETPWGTYIGTISANTLSTPTEQFFIAGAANHPEKTPDEWIPTYSFGVDYDPHLGDSEYVLDYFYTILMLLMFIALPGFILIFISLTNSQALTTNISKLKTLSAPPVTIFLYILLSAVTPYALSLVFPALFYSILLIADRFNIPIVHETVTLTDTILSIPVFLLLTITSALLVLTIAIILYFLPGDKTLTAKPPKRKSHHLVKKLLNLLFAASAVCALILILYPDIRGNNANFLLLASIPGFIYYGTVFCTQFFACFTKACTLYTNPRLGWLVFEN